MTYGVEFIYICARGLTSSCLIDVTDEEFDNWVNGMPIDEAMPRATKNGRMFLLSRGTPEAWKAAMDEGEAYYDP